MKLWKQISVVLMLFIMGSVFVAVAVADEGDPVDDVVVIDAPVDDAFTIEDMTWLDWVNFIGVSITAIAVLFIAYQTYQKGGDPALAGLIEGVQDNRPVIERGEELYENQTQQFQMTFRNLSELLMFIGSTTTLKAPAALGELMQDIQEPGPPAEVLQPEPVTAE